MSGLHFGVLQSGMSSYRSHQNVRLDRLRQISIRTTFQRINLTFAVEKSRGQLQHWNKAGGRVGLDSAADFITQDVGQLHIEKNHRWESICEFERLLTC